MDVKVSTDVGSADPDDKLLAQQWDMTHITAQTAWANGFTGTSQVRVCMIDTGVDYNHPDIIGNLWVNPQEAAGAGASSTNGYKNGIDDDGDGEHYAFDAYRTLSLCLLLQKHHMHFVHAQTQLLSVQMHTQDALTVT